MVEHRTGTGTRRPGITSAIFIALWIMQWAAPAEAQSWRLREPEPEVVQSGKCVIPVCTDFDFGDHYFRFYAPGRTIRLRYIPKGACTCRSLRSGNDVNFNDALVIEVETADGKVMPNVSLLRQRYPGDPRFRRPSETTYERYARSRGEFTEVDGFRWKDDDFAGFQVLQRVQQSAVAPARHYFFFVPKTAEFHFREQPQPVVFTNSLGSVLEGAKYTKDGPNVGAQVRLTPNILMLQFLAARLTPSKDWIQSMERAAQLVDIRLIPKSQ